MQIRVCRLWLAPPLTILMKFFGVNVDCDDANVASKARRLSEMKHPVESGAGQ